MVPAVNLEKSHASESYDEGLYFFIPQDFDHDRVVTDQLITWNSLITCLICSDLGCEVNIQEGIHSSEIV